LAKGRPILLNSFWHNICHYRYIFYYAIDRAYAISGVIMSKIVLLHWPKVGQSY
jgi:hypothetical protein